MLPKLFVGILASSLLTTVVWKIPEVSKKAIEFATKFLTETICEAIMSCLDWLWDTTICEAIKSCLDWLWDRVPGRWLRWLYPEKPYECPEWAAIYGEGRPHGNYIALRQHDTDKLKRLFDSFKYFNNTVNVVYLYGVPGSGKSELARQFGDSVFCKQDGASTVVTLNIESPDEFRRSLAASICEIEKKSKNVKDIEKLEESKFSTLIRDLKELLKERPGWLLILDNVRDPHITQKDIYLELPIPGTDQWGTGKMLVTTQVYLEPFGDHVKVEYNDGLGTQAAKELFCGLVKKDSTCCSTDVAEKIVSKLEFLPLSILAASYQIERMIKLTGSYSCQDYLAELSDALGILSAHRSNLTTTRYNHSMLTALQLAIKNANKVYSSTYLFRDFMALIGFTVDGRTISAKLVLEYLIVRGYKREEYLEITEFPLVYFLEEENRFQAHQVVSYAFREELERSETYDSLQNILKTISFYYAEQFRNSYYKYEIKEHYSNLVQNLPAQCPHLHCLTTPETERLETVSILIFETYSYTNLLTTKKGINCSKLDTFLWQLGHSPDYLNRVAVQLRFTGYQAMYTCLTTLNKVNGSFLAATKTIELIKEVAPQHSELHTVPVAWFLLKATNVFDGKQLYNQVYRFLLFPHYLRFPFHVLEIRPKLCSKLHDITKILVPKHQKKVKTYCNPDFKNSKVMGEMTVLSDCFKSMCIQGEFAYGSVQFKSIYHVPFGRSYRLEQHHATKKDCLRITNPYGACLAPKEMWRIIMPIERGKVLQFYIDYDRRVGLKRIGIALLKYNAVCYFLTLVAETQVRRDWHDYETTCQIIKNKVEAFVKKLPDSFLKPNVRFFTAYSLFVDNYCDSLHNLNLTKLHETFYTWYMNTIDVGCLHHQDIEVLLDKLLYTTGVYQERTKEITELLIEIIAATIYVSTNDNFQLGLEFIISDRAGFDVITGQRLSEHDHRYKSTTDQNTETDIGVFVFYLLIAISYILLLYFILRKTGLI